MASFLRHRTLPNLPQLRFRQSIAGYVRKQHTLVYKSGNSWITPMQQRARCAAMCVLSVTKKIVKV
jgi:hypothetical protein